MTPPEVLVIGGGTAALCAAISARRAGAGVALLEAAPRALRGGNTRHSRNLRFMHEGETPLASGRYPAQEMAADILRATQAAGDPRLTELLVQRSAEIPDWLSAAGVRFQPVASGVLPHSRKTAFLLGGGKSMLNALYRTAERLGIEVFYGVSVRGLRLRGERLEQVWIDDGIHSQTLEPKATVIACGGAQANRDWLRAHWGDAADGFINRGTPFALGEPLTSLLDQGVDEVGDPKGAYLVAVDARSPADDGGIATRVRCMPAGIVVDSSGRRFRDEGGDTASTRYAVWGERLSGCPGQIAYLILDARGLRGAPPALYPPIRGDSITELAARLDIPTGALAETLRAYNAAVRAGDGDQAGEIAAWRTQGLEPPKSRYALPLTEPPFAAYPMRPGITFTYHGVAVDPSCRVRLRNGGLLDNLFAAGMIMAPNLIPRGYVSGLALTIGIVSGRIAGEEAARHVRG